MPLCSMKAASLSTARSRLSRRCSRLSDRSVRRSAAKPTGLVGEIAAAEAFCLEKPRAALAKRSNDFFHRHVRIRAPVHEILHMAPILAIVGMQYRIAVAVEFQRRHIETVAH